MALQVQIQPVEARPEMRSSYNNNTNQPHICAWAIDNCPSCQRTLPHATEDPMEWTFDTYKPPPTNMKGTDVKGKRAVLIVTKPVDVVAPTSQTPVAYPTSAFLNLPYEIRLLIYETCAHQLLVSAACGQCNTHRAEDSHRMWMRYGNSRGTHWGVWGLVAVCHQVRTEVLPIFLCGPVDLNFRGGHITLNSMKHCRAEFRHRVAALRLQWTKDCNHISAKSASLKGAAMFPNLKHLEISGLVHQTRWRKLEIVTDEQLAIEVYKRPNGNGNSDDDTQGESKIAKILKDLVGKKGRRRLDSLVVGVEYRSAREFGDIRWKMYVKTDIVSEQLLEKSKPFPYHHTSSTPE